MNSSLKKKMFELMYLEGDVHVIILTTADGLKIPPSAEASAKENLVGFVLGMRPSPRLKIMDDGLFAMLRFGRERFQCFFPWESILQMNSKDCAVFFATGDKTDKEKDKHLVREKHRPKLKLVTKNKPEE